MNEISVLSQKESLSILLSNKKVIYGVWNKLYKRKGFWDEYRFLPMIYEDADATAQCLIRAQKIVYTGEPLYIYWKNDHSITRQKFSVKQFDDLKSRLLLIPIYEKYCPEQLDNVKASYVVVGIKLLKKSCRSKNFDTQRKETYHNIMSYVRENPNLPYTKKEKAMLSILKMGLPIFDVILSIYTKIKRLLNR